MAFSILVGVALLVCVLLILVVLAQNPKGGGLNTQFGGASTSQLMGVQRTGDLLEKMTWVLGVTLMVLSLSAHAMLGSNSAPAEVRSANIEKASKTPTATPTPAPMPGATAPAGEAAPGEATPAPADGATPAPAEDAVPTPAAEPTK